MRRSRTCNQRGNIGVDLRTRTKQLGAKETARRTNCDARFSLPGGIEFSRTFLRIGVRKLLRMGLVLAGVWRGQAVGFASSERWKLRRQMAAAACKKESVSLSLPMVVNDLEVEENLFIMVMFCWAEGVWVNRW